MSKIPIHKGSTFMNQIHKRFTWAWSILAVCTLAFAMGGCSGDDGAQGPQGVQGVQGPQGDPGVDATIDPIANAIAAADVESCSTCHSGVGGGHQAIYDDTRTEVRLRCFSLTSLLRLMALCLT